MVTQIMYNVVLSSPVVSLEKFAEMSGLTLEAAKHMWKKGEIPRAAMFQGRQMVNLVQLVGNCQKAAY